MTGFHSTFWKKIASIFFETNAFNPINFKVNDTIQPTVELSSPTSIIRTGSASSGTLYTTPTNQDFFLTHINILGLDVSSSDGTATITFTKASDNSQYSFVVLTHNGSVVRDMNFEKHPILLARNSAVNFTVNAADGAEAMIAGYLGSDRS